MQSQLRAEKIRYTYPKSHFTLRVDSFTLSRGECAALTGKNGGGKTTFGKLLAGLFKPDEGRVLLCGEDTKGWSLGRMGSQVGYLFQEPARQLFAPVVLEELTFTLTLGGLSQADANARSYGILRQFELEHLAGRSTYTLSRGEKQRLAICAMLLGGPEFLVLDEPTTGLDGRRKEILGGMLRRLRQEGLGILLISHDALFVADQAGRKLTMKGGVLDDG